MDENAQVLGGTQLMDIVDYENLQVTIKVDEYYISSIEPGQEVDVQIDSIGKTIKGVITEISREAKKNINGYPILQLILISKKKMKRYVWV